MRRLFFLALGFASLVSASGDTFDVAKEAEREKAARRVAVESALAPPVVRSINGSPLTVIVGGDMSFQIFNSAVPGSGQVFPTGCQTTADMGVFARIGTTLFSPDFQQHPCGTVTDSIGAHTAWTPVSIGNVTGTGTSADPFTVVAVGDAEKTGLRLTMTVTYVNGNNFFRKNLAFSSTAGQITFDVFLGSDLFLAADDNGIPFFDTTSGSVGGKDCGNPPTYTILLIPLTPASSYSGTGFDTIWSQIGAGSLPSTVATACIDNGAALQWRARSVSAAAPVTLQTATSFGTIPQIAQFRVDSVTPSQANPGQTLTVVVTGIGFQTGTTFDFGAGITVNSAPAVGSSTQATVSISVGSNAAPGFRNVTGTQSSGGLTSTLANGFQVAVACAAPNAPVNPFIRPVGNPSGPVTGIDVLNVVWSAPASGTVPTAYEWAINGDPFVRETNTFSFGLPRGSNSPITLHVRARGCVPESTGPAADSPTYIPAPPIANFSASATASAGATVTFTDTSSPQATSWLWIFGDGTFDTKQSPTHVFSNRGGYSVALIASNGAGSSVKSQSLTVQSIVPLAARTVRRDFDSSDPERPRLSNVVLEGTGKTWLSLSTTEGEEVIVYLRFLDESGALVEERRLSLSPGQDALYDLGAYGLSGTYSLELVSSRAFSSAVIETAPSREPRKRAFDERP